MTVDQLLRELLGPFGLTVGLVVAVGWLGKQGVQFIRDTITDARGQRDEAQALARQAIEGLKLVSSGQEDLHEAFLEYTRAAANRKRRDDA